MSQNTQLKAASMLDEGQLIDVLRNSLYPGAADDSVKMVIGYCKAAGLDPMQKPVHIVPIWDGKAKTMRDVVMPGIGLYRTQAARSGGYAGVSEPEFGDEVTETLDGVKVAYPKWCRVTVKRQMPNGAVVDFTALEFWKENYATKGRDSAAPNSMWAKRPFAQLAKCAESQALRKAFPEFGGAATAEEMEGKVINEDVIQQITAEKTVRAINPPYPDESLEANLATWRGIIEAGKKTPDQIIAMVEAKYTMTTDQKMAVAALAPLDGEVA